MPPSNGGSECCGISRRRFLGTTAAVAGALPFIAGPFTRQAHAAVEHYVPADKMLSPAWVSLLTARGAPTAWSGTALTMLGMPVGGIAAGQLYLSGEGRLTCWMLYNKAINVNHGFRGALPGLALDQGFAVRVQPLGSAAQVRRLGQADFPNLQYYGQYPLNRVHYPDPAFPVDVTLEAFSPFIPQNELDSTLPCTLLEYTVKNTSAVPVEVSLAGWMENPVGAYSARNGLEGRRGHQLVRNAAMTRVDFAGKPADPGTETRPTLVFASFESPSYGAWSTEGTAFGSAPATGKIGAQDPVTGYLGNRLVNSFNPNDSATGKLTSPEFAIERKAINFLVGGGSSADQTYIRLLVEGNEVARSAGKDSEQLEWASWDVTQHQGKPARIEIVDNGTGAWGHILVDQIEFSDVRPPIIYQDFEGADYGAWTTTGTCFGSGPAHGTLPNQQAVSGFIGQGLVNTYLNSDTSRGTLTSPSFTIERNFINFLVGGGSNSSLVYIRLTVEGGEVYRAAGKDRELLEWTSWDVTAHLGKSAQIQIVDNATGGWGHINVDQIEFSDEPRIDTGAFGRQSDYGTACLCLLEEAGGAYAGVDAAYVSALKFWDSRGRFGVSKPDEVLTPLSQTTYGVLGKSFTLPPDESRTLRFLFTWHFPMRPPLHPETTDMGNYYATRFADASAVAEYVQANYARLAGDTRRYHTTFYEDSTLPWWFLERIGHTPSIMATETLHWRANGRVWGWEGTGCCEGTCTHVWNYEHAMARLFPGLERRIREIQDFDYGFYGNGIVSFRGDSYDTPQYAADGQAGTVLKAYREHLTSSDNGFLTRNWSHIKRALEYSMGHDGDDDGVIEDSQHNTYDINFIGANTMVGSLYLAALLAGEAMAKVVGDADFADRCRRVFDAGSAESAQRLFDGEYFIQDIDWNNHPDYQYGPGCLSDQLFGQGWAHQLGLGYIYPKEAVLSALAGIYKYNWAPDIEPQNDAHPPGRWFARPGNAGLFVCTWPKSDFPPGNQGVLYRNEVWTGIEYQVAGNMLYDGLVTEALAIIRGIHERHDGVLHNPWNEVECGDHYARAMAGWGCFTAAAGFYYNGPEKRIGFAPRMLADDFAAFFSAAEGWGLFSQTRQAAQHRYRLRLDWGQLALSELSLDGAGLPPDGAVVVKLNGQDVPADVQRQDSSLVLGFTNLMLTAGDTLEVVAAK